MSHKPLTYYIDTPEIHKLIDFAGDRFENFTHENLWDLITVISGELSGANPNRGTTYLVDMQITKEALNLGFDAVVDHALEILDGISRHDSKLLLLGLNSIAAYSDIH